MKAIVNGILVLKDRLVRNSALIFDGRILEITDPSRIPAGTEILDAAGGYVCPGLIDLHIHGYAGHDVCDGDPEGLRIMSEALIRNGVTGYLPTTMTVDRKVIEKSLDTVRAAMTESLNWKGSVVLGAHAEGPYINPSKKGAQNEKYILKPAADLVKAYADTVKIITLAPEMDPDFQAIREIVRDTDTVVSMGHTGADYETARKATEAGVRHTTHLFNAMTSLAHRAPGVVGAALNSDVSVELIVDTFHVNPALYDMIYRLKGRRFCFITDCLPAGGLPEGEYTLGGQKFISKGIECRLPDGTIAGSILALNKGVRNVFVNSSIPLWECVNCASLNPAAVIGLQDRKGSLEIGKDADIMICDSDFNVKFTIIGGEIKYESKD